MAAAGRAAHPSEVHIRPSSASSCCPRSRAASSDAPPRSPSRPYEAKAAQGLARRERTREGHVASLLQSKLPRDGSKIAASAPSTIPMHASRRTEARCRRRRMRASRGTDAHQAAQRSTPGAGTASGTRSTSPGPDANATQSEAARLVILATHTRSEARCSMHWCCVPNRQAS
jgi:hypothetical protein